MPVPRTPTTREIAAACGCSQATVSLALRDSSEIGRATRERIQGIAKTMGWKPNPLVSAYMAHFRSTAPPRFRASLAWLNSNPVSGKIGDMSNYDLRIYGGAKQRAQELGYGLEPVWLHEPGMTGRRFSKVLKSRGIPGLIIPGIVEPEDPAALWTQIDWEILAAVTVGFRVESPELSHVMCNLSHGVEVALATLRKMGYRRIAMVVSHGYDRYVNHGLLYPFYYHEREHGPDEWAKSHIFPNARAFERKGVVHIQVDPKSRRSIRRWLEHHRPEVVIGDSVVWDVLQEMGWNIPGDVAFVSLGWSPRFPHVGGIDQCPEVLGALAVDLVWAQLLQNERGTPAIPKSLQVEGRWQDGASVPRRGIS